MKRIKSSEINESTQSLALIMPLMIDQLLGDQNEDNDDSQSNE